MKNAKNPRRTVVIVASVLLLLCGIFLTRAFRNNQGVSSAAGSQASASAADSSAAKADRVTKLREPTVMRYRSQDDGIPVKLSMHEVAVIDADGKTNLTLLNPPATPATLAKRIAELEAPLGVMPVAYLEGEDGSSAARRFVTSDIRAKMPQDQAEKVAKEHGLTIKDRPWYAPEWVVFSAAQPLDALAKIDGIRMDSEVELADVLLAVQGVPRALPNDPLVTNQWHIKASGAAVAGSDLNIEDAWKFGATGGVLGTGVTIGIVDDGLQTAHPDLAANVNVALGYDWNGNDNDPNPGPGDSHGTSCAGVAAAKGNNSLGVTGTAPEAKLVGMRLIAGAKTDLDEAEAMTYNPNLIPILSNSWGPPDSGEGLDKVGPLTLNAFATATTSGRNGKGTIILWAGGNGAENKDNSNYDSYANSIYTIAIGATDSKGNRAGYSEPGANIVVCAPSSGRGGALGITTTDVTGNGNGYNPAGDASGGYTNTFGGTSSATPAAAGVVALMLEANPNLGWRDVQDVLIRSAKKIKPTDGDWVTNAAGLHFNHNFGAGLVDATAAVDRAKTHVNLDPMVSAVSTKNGISVPIPNNSSAGTTVTFDLPSANITAEYVTLKVSISHDARGDLEIFLTSPSGTVSRLAEVHDDLNDNYSSYTLSTVRNWGEDANGTWTLKIADRKSTNNTKGGTLTSAQLTVFGESSPPTNPPPTVEITSPANGAVFSPGVGYTVDVAVTDFDINGAPSAVSKVELFANGDLVGTLTSAPFSFPLNPANDTYTYVAKATDQELLEASSSPVTVTVKNQTPVINFVVIDSGDQAYDDTPLTVTSVSATDPENDPITIAYKWQSSTNAETYADTAFTAATLPPNPANSGKLWRCAITASDGMTTSAPTFTTPVNLLDRPSGTAVAPGTFYSYQSGLVLKGDTLEINRQAIIHEFSQGPNGGTAEWIEILTLQAGSLSGWTLQDQSGNTLRFSESGAWDNVPAGTLIVVFNGGQPRDLLVPPESSDFASGSAVVSSVSATFFQAGSAWPILDNIGDAILLKDSSGTSVHEIAYGNSFFTTPNVGSVPSGQAAYFAGQSDAGANLPGNWLTTTGGSARSAFPSVSDPGPKSIFPGAVFSNGRYGQDFNSEPGPSGTEFPEGWSAYSIQISTTQTTNYDSLQPPSEASSAGGVFNSGSRIGILGGVGPDNKNRFDPGFFALALDNTTGLTGLKISYDIIKISEQARSMNLNLEYTTGNPANTGTVWIPIGGGAHNSGSTPSGTVTRLTNVPLPAVFQDRASPIYLRWYYRTSTNNQNAGFRDWLAIDNVLISSNSSPNIFMTLSVKPSTIRETDGPNASVGTVTINEAIATPLTVGVSSSDISEVTVPATVVIPAGQLSATFPIAAVDDAFSDGTQTATITVSAPGFLNESKVMTITDNEPILVGVTPGEPNNPGNASFVDRIRTGRLFEPAKYYLASGSVLPAGLTLNQDTGLISGTISPTAALGAYTVVIEIRNVLGEFASQTIVINVSDTAVSSFAQWIAPHNIPDKTPTGDSDFDQLPNLLEYALNSNPTGFDNPSPVISERTANSISLTYSKSKNAPDVLLTVEWSETMAVDSWATTGIVHEILVDGANSQTIKSTVTIDPAHPAKFMRLRAVQVPD